MGNKTKLELIRELLARIKRAEEATDLNKKEWAHFISEIAVICKVGLNFDLSNLNRPSKDSTDPEELELVGILEMMESGTSPLTLRVMKALVPHWF